MEVPFGPNLGVHQAKIPCPCLWEGRQLAKRHPVEDDNYKFKLGASNFSPG
jgi:hypothetical protein